MSLTEPLIDRLPLRDLPINVAGEWRRGRGHAYASVYPADGSVSAELHAASADDTDEAIERAHDAYRKSDWRTRKPHERALVLYRVAESIRARRDELAHLQRRDNGKPIGETRALVDSAAGTFQFMAAACETLEEQITPQRGAHLTMSVHERSSSSRPRSRRWPRSNWRASASSAACRRASSACCRARARWSATRSSGIRSSSACRSPAAPRPAGRSRTSRPTR
jgi:hypothetical protein